MKTLQKLSVRTLRSNLEECSYWIESTIRFISHLSEGKKFNNKLQRFEPLDSETLTKRDNYIKNNMKLILEQYELKSNIEKELKNRNKL